MGAAAIPLMVASMAVSVISAVQSSDAQASASRYAAQVAQNNQNIANSYAVAAKQQGEVEAQNKQMQISQQQGAITAAVGGSGFDDSGTTAKRLSADTTALGNMDVATIRSNAAKAAYGYQVQGMNYAAQGQQDLAAASNAESAGELKAIGGVISAAGGVSDKWASFQTNGVGDYSQADPETAIRGY